ncbi:MAG TPA: 16S rRNA (guanine(527)-N(7))-methyltransferase RsmG [Microbacteriaceae bacterium]|jgi:16S rRNA (guanine527-N7)-methyltransferase|nr:16S rRNA (guanine(527)-N(7))-methyltransferase RsmG [Microbacteriaceae bacterium]HPZ35024.1 16S rRNA (guanine(527)-N(7))-methyltransferase RsmG [Microbacteriaceae bacterium]HQC92489.1 16S rRNA (guanine(527)-N(7))-methyltransferase RsmG [Microbacteriaceae bacterium]
MTDHNDDVSRETSPATLEAEPAIAATLFGDTIAGARQFAAALAAQGEERGLIGPLELPRLWTRHILNSVIMAPLLNPGRVGDIGTGAGLPGLVLAIARPDVQFVLIEPMERRVAWLNEQVDELGLRNVEVVRARAEEAKAFGGLDQVTARAVSALRTLIPLTAPLVCRGGELVLMKGINAEAEIAAAEKQIRRFKLHDVRVEILGDGVLEETTRVVRATVDRDERATGSVSRETFG